MLINKKVQHDIIRYHMKQSQYIDMKNNKRGYLNENRIIEDIGIQYDILFHIFIHDLNWLTQKTITEYSVNEINMFINDWNHDIFEHIESYNMFKYKKAIELIEKIGSDIAIFNNEINAIFFCANNYSTTKFSTFNSFNICLLRRADLHICSDILKYYELTKNIATKLMSFVYGKDVASEIKKFL